MDPNPTFSASSSGYHMVPWALLVHFAGHLDPHRPSWVLLPLWWCPSFLGNGPSQSL